MGLGGAWPDRRAACEYPQRPGVARPGPSQERKKSWCGPAFSCELPQGWAVPSLPPEGVKKTWDVPAFSCQASGRRIVLGLASVLVLSLGACATAPPKPEPEPTLVGRLVAQVSEVPGEPARQFSAGFELRGHALSGELDLLSPLGTVMARARWHDGGVQLATGNETYRFRSPADLSRRLLGEPLPLEALFDWLKGRPWEGAPHTVRPQGFEQAGWEVDVSGLSRGLLAVQRDGPRPVRLRVRLELPS